MSESHDIYVRAHTTRLQKDKPAGTRKDGEPKWPEFALVFDCESRITADQSLTFGFWRFCILRNNSYVCMEEGIFHDYGVLRSREFDALRTFARATKPDTAEDGCDRLRVYSCSKFVHEVFGIAMQAKALIVGFNLPFDLSRLALDWESARNGGWSLILAQWRNRSGLWEENKFFPRIVVKALNSKTAIIQSLQPWKERIKKKGKKARSYPRARFLDLRTLLWTLRNKSYSLKTACKEFGIRGKLDHKPSGRVDLEEIEYCRQDVQTTVGLLNAAKQEFDLHPIAPGPDEMFSPASVAKSYLKQLNITYPSAKVKDADSAYGIFMQAYFGGRAECRVRNWEVPVCPVDFMSQYPTVNELLGNWSVLTAKEVAFPEATEEVRQFLSQITLQGCFDPKLWPQFKFFALVHPDEDILPVRTVYNGTTQNIGINYLTSKEPIWFAGPEVMPLRLTSN